MATIMIGSARSDENGKSSGGTAGDQKQTSSTNDTAGEVSIQQFYVHSLGWYVFRPKSVTHANAIAERMTAACNNKHIGYDQGNRGGIWTYGIDTTTDTECDCSSLMRQVIKEATGTDPGNFRTVDEPTFLAKTGLFEDKVKYTSGYSLANGDVLVTCSSGHTVAVVSGNARAASTTSAKGSYKTGDKITLTKVALYCAATSKTKANTVTGDYYIWSDTGVNNRIMITNSSANVGKINAVTGWINVSDIPGTSTTTTTTSSSSSATIESTNTKSSSLAGTYKVNTSKGLNLRVGAGTGKTSIGVMTNGTTVKCYGYYKTVGTVKWLCVQVTSGTYSGKEGYCSSEYLKKS